jgi:cytochrome b involved in lipid metabolism
MVLVEVPWLHPAQMAVVVDGQVYDLKEFINKHPGGGSFLIFSKGKDITIR